MEKEPRMNELIREEMSLEILSNFDFEKVQAIMVLLGITFPDYPGAFKEMRHVPSVEELKVEARMLLERAWLERAKWKDEPDTEKHVNGLGGWCGHLAIEISAEGFEMAFQPITSESYFEDHK